MGKKRRILVVDDDPDICIFGRTILELNGYEVVTASSAAEGLQVARATPPHLAILDIMMEEVDSGIQLARQLHDLYPDVPIVLLSTLASVYTRVYDTSQISVVQFVDKPLGPVALVEMVGRLLYSRGSEPAPA